MRVKAKIEIQVWCYEMKFMEGIQSPLTLILSHQGRGKNKIELSHQGRFGSGLINQAR
ncbi:hypothetical protein RT761_01443 [Atribacter laminatus]|jgi:hypothetical protein|uniref:Uncharacterized protein n=1 Tax=Atribacter laminatus TaxID=2847778 RepID=A0A7T1ALN7_ATRLM|nr:hypothetical protein RT761_01443 [Atribacter laminatus]